MARAFPTCVIHTCGSNARTGPQNPRPEPGAGSVGDGHENTLAVTMVGLSKTQVPSHGHVRAFVRGEARLFALRYQNCGLFCALVLAQHSSGPTGLTPPT